MENLKQKKHSTDTLLALMNLTLEKIEKSVDNIEKKLEAKVDIVDFVRLEKSLDEHKKESELRHKETSEKVNSHAVKIGIGASLLTAGSWLISLIK